MQMALAALQDRQLTQAEEILLQVRQLEPSNLAAGLNLYWTRLSLGQTAQALEMLPDILELGTAAEQRRLLHQLQMLLKGGAAAAPTLAMSLLVLRPTTSLPSAGTGKGRGAASY